MIRVLPLAALLAGACSNAASQPAGGAYQRGVAALEAGDPHTARIEFLNAIKADPDNDSARVMQARTYLALGDGVAADAELGRVALAADQVQHLRAHARLLRGDPGGAVEAAALAGADHAAYAHRIRGQALAALGDGAAAAEAFDLALAAAPDDPATWVEIARFRRDSGDIAGALAAADRAIGSDAADADALVLRGELTRSQYGLRAAIPWFNRALEVDPDHVPALLERAATHGDLGQASALLADTRAALTIEARNPRAFYLQAMIAARAGNFRLARSLYERTGNAFDGQPAAILLAAAIDFESGNAAGAVRRLESLVAMQPANDKARRFLAAAYWKVGNEAATIETLWPIARRADADSYSLALIGRALAKAGDGDAAYYLARAATPQRRAPAALLAGAIDDAELERLRRAAASAPGHAPSEIAYAGGLLAAGRGGEALALARQLQAAHPGVPDAHMLVGDALDLTGDPAAAAEQYRAAANLAFSEPVAMRLVGALDRSGRREAATQALRLYLGQNPRSVPALLLAAARYMEAGEWQSAIDIYEGLRRRLGDNDALLLNNLALAYGETGHSERAVALATRARALDPANPVTTDTLGWLMVRAGQKAEGLALLNRAQRLGA